MKTLFGRFLKDESGLELSEYAIMAGLIIIVAVAVILTVGGHIKNIFTTLGDKLGEASNASAS